MEKICIVCDSSFLDSSKWKRGQTCSKDCSTILMVQRRQSEGTYIRSKEACAKDQATKTKMREESYSEVSNDQLIKIYEQVLDGTLTRFPLGLFQFGDYKTRGIVLVKYLVEEKMKLSSDEEILSFLTFNNLVKYKLGAQVLIKCFNKHIWNVIDICYPGKFKKWQAKNQNSLWSKGKVKNYELAREATRWLVEEILGLSQQTLIGNINHQTFKQYDLESMLACVYNSSYISALLDCYPELDRSLFPQTQEIANLGYKFEAICESILRKNNLNIINKTFKTKSLNCPDLVFSKDHWGDIKISTSAYFNSRSDEYLKYCKKLTIIYLAKNAQVENTEQIEFVTLDDLVLLDNQDREQLDSIKQQYFKLLKE